MKKYINSVINFRRVTHFRLCLLETQVSDIMWITLTDTVGYLEGELCLVDPLPPVRLHEVLHHPGLLGESNKLLSGIKRR